MAATVSRLRPREFYAVVPGAGGGPGQGRPVPVGYAKTLDGLESALAHAQHLAAGGGTQDVLLITGREVMLVMRFGAGGEHTTGGEPSPSAGFRPASVTEVRPGARHGRIPELDRTAMARKAGKPPRRNRNCPRPQWPGIESITTKRETP